MPPPLSGGDAVDWVALRDECGIDFPTDFKTFMEEYGGGVIENTLWLPSFVGSLDDWRNEYVNAREELHYDPEDSEVQPAGSAVEVPESGPLVPWAVSPAGTVACWYASEPDPDRWPVVVFKNRQAPQWAVYDGGFSWFLAAFILGEVVNPFGVEIRVGGGRADYLNWRDERTLRQDGIRVGGYIHDRSEFFSQLFAAGHDPLRYFPSAARVEGLWRA